MIELVLLAVLVAPGVAWAALVLRHRLRRPAVRSCSLCGCTDARACPGGCWWIGPELCSRCGPVLRGAP